MSFYDDLDRCMQNPEFRRSYEEQARQLNGAESATVPIRQRPIPDQLDYFSTKLAGLLDGAKLERETLIIIGAAVVNIGAIAAQLRAQPLPSITDAISDVEAEASATLDLTIDEVRALHPDDAAVAEVRAWLPEGTPDNALIELEAHTLRGVLAVLDQWEQNARTAAAQRNAAEGSMERAKVDMRLLREDVGDANKRADAAEALKRAAYADRSAAIERADEAERELAELRERIGNVRQTEWGSGKGESGVKLCGAPNDAYDYARAYGERVFTRKLYAGPWQPDDEEGDDDA